MSKQATPTALLAVTDAELRAALLSGLQFWSRSTGSNLSPVAAEEMTVQQLVAIRRAAQRHAADLVKPTLPPPVRHWQDRD